MAKARIKRVFIIVGIQIDIFGKRVFDNTRFETWGAVRSR